MVTYIIIYAVFAILTASLVSPLFEKGRYMVLAGLFFPLTYLVFFFMALYWVLCESFGEIKTLFKKIKEDF